ncbi:MAG: hypothetical protein MJ156_00435 [Alphaproteobacteria bacterium]|nr:hypothetical protein [Alphaproteobacteria bacterium]
MYTFEAGKGINCNKLNDNFDEVKDDANANEQALQTIDSTALRKDGSNLTAQIISAFNQVTPVVLTNQSGTISLSDNTTYFISLSGNATISLPSVPSDQRSHTIIVVVHSNNKSFNPGTTKHLATPAIYDNTKPFQYMYIYNKIDNSWYYCVGQ